MSNEDNVPVNESAPTTPIDPAPQVDASQEGGVAASPETPAPVEPAPVEPAPVVTPPIASPEPAPAAPVESPVSVEAVPTSPHRLGEIIKLPSGKYELVKTPGDDDRHSTRVPLAATSFEDAAEEVDALLGLDDDDIDESGQQWRIVIG